MRRCLNCFKEINDELDLCPFCGYVEGTPPEAAIHMVPGTILDDRYIIGKVVGYGGFGVTYAAWDGKLLQKVAIKEYLPSEFSTRMPGQSRVTVFNGDKSEQYNQGLKKFVDEARRLAKFTNEEGIVRVFDCIESNDTAYIIMEFLEGDTLTDYLKREGTIPEDKAVEMLMPIMESLKSVHAKGIIHRDIAPDNIFLTTDGKVKLIDFGAARFATTSHSRSLTVIVKPGYSAEEQYMSRSDQGPHTDVYSLAATLYKMITGTTPPDALERRAKVENTHKDIIVDPRKINKSISIQRENAIMNALNIRVEDRTPTIEQFMKELESDPPVPRRYGKIKKIDFYTWPLWLKIAVPLLCVLIITFGTLVATGVIRFDSLFTTAVEIPDGYTEVPDVSNKTIAEAMTVIQTAELNVKQNAVTSDLIDAGSIISQMPKSGKVVPVNSDVTLLVSRGNGDIVHNRMPYFNATNFEIVYTSLSEAGFTFNKENEKYEYNDSIVEGDVIRVVLDDGSEAVFGNEYPAGTHVTLYISLGRETFAMPDLVGKTEQEARKIIKDCGLQVDEENVKRVENSSYASGIVCGQSVSAGNDIKKSDPVSFTVSIGGQTKSTEAKTNTATPTKKPNTPTPTKKPTPTNTSTPTPTPKPSIEKHSDVEIHHENGESSKSVKVDVKNWNSQIEWSSSNTSVCSATGNGTSATLSYNGRGRSTITVILKGTSVSTSFEVRCFDYVYGSWGSIQQSKSEVSETDTRRRAEPYKVSVKVGTRHAKVRLDYYCITNNSAKNKRAFYWWNNDSQYLRYHWAADNGEYIAYCSDGQTPDDFTAVAPGGNSNGSQSGSNFTNRVSGKERTGYYCTDYLDGARDGRIFFIMGYIDEDVYETRYQYQERSRSVSCD